MSKLKSESLSASLETALYVLEQGWATIDQIRDANKWRLAQSPRIGKLAHNIGKLTMAQVLTVLEEQRIRGKLFGETAIELGYLTVGEVYELLNIQADFTPCLLDALLELQVISSPQAEQVAEATADSEAHVISAETIYEPGLC
jgi:hypothetical protein